MAGATIDKLTIELDIKTTDEKRISPIITGDEAQSLHEALTDLLADAGLL